VRELLGDQSAARQEEGEESAFKSTCWGKKATDAKKKRKKNFFIENMVVVPSLKIKIFNKLPYRGAWVAQSSSVCLRPGS